MTCARRDAGAHRPAPSASTGSSRPDPRGGRSRGRLFGFLPALPLLLGALSPFAAAPAAADLLVSNIHVPRDSRAGLVAEISNVPQRAQGFTTGGNAPGYVLTNIVLNAADAVSHPASLVVELWSANESGLPGTKLASLRVPDTVGAGSVSFAAPTGTTLDANTKYFVFVDRDGAMTSGSLGWVEYDPAYRDPIVYRGMADWGMDRSFYYTLRAQIAWTAFTDSSLMMSVNGRALVPPAAPTSLSAVPLNTQLELTWTAPSGTVTGYEAAVKRTSAADQDATTEGDPSTGWVVHTPSGTGTVYTLTGLTNDVSYDVRVRAIDAIAAGAWTTTVMATPTAPSIGMLRNLRAGPAGSGRLKLTWLPPDPVPRNRRGVQIHITTASADTVGNHAPASGSDASVGWVSRRSGIGINEHTLSGLTDGTLYRLRARDVAQSGRGAWTFATGTPGARDFSVPSLTAMPGDGYLDLSWAEPASQIAGYRIEYTSAPSSTVADDATVSFSLSNFATHWVRLEQGDALARSYRLSGLTNGTEYRVRVLAVGDEGSFGAWSFVKGTPTPPPAAPTDLDVIGADGGLDLTWTAPAGPVTGYDVHYTSAPDTGQGAVEDDAEASGADPMAGWVDAPHAGTAAWHRIAGLDKGVAYRVRVRGVNAIGVGAWAFGSLTQVPRTAPGEVTGLEVRPASTVLNVSWLAPSDTGGWSNVSYRLHYTSSATVAEDAPAGSNAAQGWVATGRTVSGTSHQIRGLTNGTTYRVRVQAHNDSGYSAWVHGTSAPTASPPPGLTGLTLAVGGTGIDLAPAFSGSRLNYTAVVLPDATSVTVTPTWTGSGQRRIAASSGTPQGSGITASTDISSSGGSATVDLASSGDTWVFVNACWGGGNNCNSYRITVSRGPAPVPPSVPSRVQVTPGDGKLTLTWQAPSSWGAWTASRYEVQWKLSSAAGGWLFVRVRVGQLIGVYAPAATETSFVFTGAQDEGASAPTVTNGTAYDLRIRAISQQPGSRGNQDRHFRESDWVTVEDSTPTASPPPGPVTGLTVSPGAGKLDLAWTAPSGTVTGYDVHYTSASADDVAATADASGNDASAAWVDAGHSATAAAHAITGLTNGTAYRVRVRASNAGGGGAWEFGAGTAGATGPVTELRVGAADGELELSWTAPSGTVTGYDVHYTSSASVSATATAAASGSDPAAGWVDAGHAGTAATHTIAVPAKGTRYRVRVRGVGAGGAGAWTYGARTVPATAPGAPTGLNVVPGNRVLDVSWLAPADTGARGVTVGYAVHYTYSSTVAGGAAVGTNAAQGWVAVGRAVVGTSHQIQGQTNGTPIWVRVRTETDVGSSTWVISDPFTPKATPPPRLTGLTLAAGGTDIALDPAFSGTRLTYTAAVRPDATSVSVTPTWTATGVSVNARSVAGDGSSITGSTTIASSGGSESVDLASSGDTLVVVDVCKQSNCHGYVITVSRLVAPSVPRNVQVTPGDGKLTLTWQAPSDWGSWPAQFHFVQWKRSSQTDWGPAILGTDTALLDPAESSFEFTGNQLESDNTPHTVANGTAYDLRIHAASQQPGTDGNDAVHYLESAWVTISDSTPTATPPPAAPTGLAATPGAGRLDLSWAAPSGTVTGYDVHYTSASADDVTNLAAASGSDASLAWVDAGHSGTTPVAAVTGLTGDTAYRVRVRASNANGAGAWAFGDGTPQPVPPSAPQNVQVTPGDGKLTLAWEAPSDWGSWTALHFQVQWKLSSAGDSAWNSITLQGTATLASTVTSVEFTGIQYDADDNDYTVANGTAYDLRIRAVSQQPGTDGNDFDNHFRDSAWVTVADNTPAASPPPGRVTELGVTAGDGQLDLSWTAPTGTLTGYDVHYTSAPATGAGAVTNDAAASGSDAATAWVALDRGTEADPPAASQAISGLTNGTAYRVRVRASNANGAGAWEFGTGTPAVPAAPGAVTGLTVSAFDGLLTVHWTAPSGTVTGYDVHYTSASADDVTNDAAAGSDAATAWVEVSRTERDPPLAPLARQGISGLTNGTAYRVRVRASNANGDGDWAFGAGTPDAGAVNPPTAPGNVAAAPGDGKLTLTWQAPSDWGTWTPLQFEVQWKRSSEGAANWRYVLGQGQEVTIGPTATSFEFAGIQEDFGSAQHAVVNGTAYDLRIRARTQKPGTDGSDPANHFRFSAWVTVENKVPMAPVPRAPTVAPTASQTLWSAVLTVGAVTTSNGQPVVLGCRNGTGSACRSLSTPRLTDDDFTFDGAEHEVTGVTLDNADALTFLLNKSLSGKKNRLALFVGGVPFYGRDARFVSGTTPANSRLEWTNTGLPGWSAGDTVRLRLVELPTVELTVTPNPVPEGTRVSVEAKLWRSTGSDSPVPHIPRGGTVRVPVIVTPGTADPYHDYGEGSPRADGTRRFPIAIHGAFQTSAGVFNFDTHKDGDTKDETFTVAVDTASLTPSVVAGSGSSVTVTIKDLDEPVDLRGKVRFSVRRNPVAEGGSAYVSVLLTQAPAADVTVRFLVTRGTSEEGDHGMLEEGVLIPAGHCCNTAPIRTVVDGDTDDETFTVALDAESLPSGLRPDPDASAPVEVTVIDNGLPVLLTDEEPLTAREGTDAAITFKVRLSVAARESVSVDYATSESDGRTVKWMGRYARRATSGADFTAASGTLTFAPGETEKTVRVAILNDAVNEGPEYFLHRLSNPKGAYLARERAASVGLILNDDHLQAMWLARFGRTVGSQVTEAVSDRLGSGLAPGAHVTLAGQALDLSKADDAKVLAEAMTGLAQAFGAPDAPANDDPGSSAFAGAGSSGAGEPFARRGLGGAWNDPTTATARAMTGREVLVGSAFHVAPANDGSGPALAAWGRVAQDSFDGEHADDTGTTRVDGEVVTGVLGADADFGRVLAGVAVSLSEGTGTFDAADADVGGSGKIESTMTTVSPYARFRVTERVSVWGLAGWGTGDMTIEFDKDGDGEAKNLPPVRTDLSMQLGAVGARGEILEQGEAGLMDLALKADAFFVRTESEKAENSAETQVDASRVRLVLEGGKSFALSETAALRPSLELGVRHDGGDAETGTGVEVGGGVSWSDTASGLSVEAKARMLVAHADSDYEEWGASATARLDPDERGRGLSLSLAPTIGETSSASERLWGARDARGLAPGPEFEAARGLTAEAGYGMGLLGDRFTGTPNVGFGISDGGVRDYRIGWRLTSVVPGDPGFEVSLDATRREAANGNEPPEHGVMLRGAIRW